MLNPATVDHDIEVTRKVSGLDRCRVTVQTGTAYHSHQLALATTQGDTYLVFANTRAVHPELSPSTLLHTGTNSSIHAATTDLHA